MFEISNKLIATKFGFFCELFWVRSENKEQMYSIYDIITLEIALDNAFWWWFLISNSPKYVSVPSSDLCMEST